MPIGNTSADALFLFLTSATGGVNSVAAYSSSLASYSKTGSNFGDKLPNIENVGSGSEWYSPYHPVVQVIGWIVASLLSLETIVGNAMVIVAYKIERSISKQVGNRFIVSLAISDLIIGIEGIPLFTVYVINGDRWPLGRIACETWLFLDYTLCLVSILTVLLITADRYLSVCHTAEYLKWQNPLKIQLLIIFSWIIPAAIFGVMIYGWPIISANTSKSETSVIDSKRLLTEHNIFLTEVQSNTNGECFAPFLSNPYINMSMYVAYYWTTLIAMLILYKGIHKAAKKLEKKAKAKEHRHIALLLTQRLGTQVGVSLMLQSKKQEEELVMFKSETKDSGYNTNTLSTTGISAYPATCLTAEHANVGSRRSSSIFHPSQLRHHSSSHHDTSSNEQENDRNITITKRKKQWRKKSATIAEGINHSASKYSWLSRKLGNINRFRPWSHSETVHQQVALKRKLSDTICNNAIVENNVPTHHKALSEIYTKEKFSSETFSLDDMDEEYEMDEENLPLSWTQKPGGIENNDSSQQKSKGEISFNFNRQLLLLGPPNTPDLEAKCREPDYYDSESLSTVFNNQGFCSMLQLEAKFTEIDSIDNNSKIKLSSMKRTFSLQRQRQKSHIQRFNSVPLCTFAQYNNSVSSANRNSIIHATSASSLSSTIKHSTNSKNESNSVSRINFIGTKNTNNTDKNCVPDQRKERTQHSKSNNVHAKFSNNISYERSDSGYLKKKQRQPQPHVTVGEATKKLVKITSDNPIEDSETSDGGIEARNSIDQCCQTATTSTINAPKVSVIQSTKYAQSPQRTNWIRRINGRVTDWMSASQRTKDESLQPRASRSSSTTSSNSFSSGIIANKREHQYRSSFGYDDGLQAPKPSIVPQKNESEKRVTIESLKNSIENNYQVKGSAENDTATNNYLGLGQTNNDLNRKISTFKYTSDRLIQSVFAPISAFNRIRKRTKAEKRAHKAFRTITFIVGLFAILWSPYYVVATIYGFCKGECVPSILYNLSYYMCYLNSSGNPFAYALANRQFRSAFIRMFHGDFNRIA